MKSRGIKRCGTQNSVCSTVRCADDNESRVRIQLGRTDLDRVSHTHLKVDCGPSVSPCGVNDAKICHVKISREIIIVHGVLLWVVVVYHRLDVAMYYINGNLVTETQGASRSNWIFANGGAETSWSPSQVVRMYSLSGQRSRIISVYDNTAVEEPFGTCVPAVAPHLHMLPQQNPRFSCAFWVKTMYPVDGSEYREMPASQAA